MANKVIDDRVDRVKDKVEDGLNKVAEATKESLSSVSDKVEQTEVYKHYDNLSDSRQKYLLLILGLVFGFVIGKLF